MINRLNIKNFGLASGITFAISYLGCIFTMLVLPHEMTIRFFNSVLHGIDVESVVRWDVPFAETLIGFSLTFVLGVLFGTLFAASYNVGILKTTDSAD
jgi:hypothetical protein